MIVGGWVEGLYISTEVAKTNDSPELRQRIAEQKLSLKDLIALVDSYNIQDATLEGVRADLAALQVLFEEVKQPAGESTVSEERGVAVVGSGGEPATLTDAQLVAISEKATTIRTNFIN